MSVGKSVGLQKRKLCDDSGIELRDPVNERLKADEVIWVVRTARARPLSQSVVNICVSAAKPPHQEVTNWTSRWNMGRRIYADTRPNEKNVPVEMHRWRNNGVSVVGLTVSWIISRYHSAAQERAPPMKSASTT